MFFLPPAPPNFKVEGRTLSTCWNNCFFAGRNRWWKTTPDNIDVGGCGGHVPKSTCVIVFITDTGRVVPLHLFTWGKGVQYSIFIHPYTSTYAYWHMCVHRCFFSVYADGVPRIFLWALVMSATVLRKYWECYTLHIQRTVYVQSTVHSTVKTLRKTTVYGRKELRFSFD